MSWPACGSGEGAEVPPAGLPAILSQHAHFSFIFSQHSIFGFSAGAAWACATPGRAIATATAVINLFMILNSVKSKKERFHASLGGGVGSFARKARCSDERKPARIGA